MKYYGVIGNRDYIKIGGEKRPFWEFLDEQPYGYLTSLVYMRKDLPPNTPMIFDCGAWSYRTEDVPKITPKLAYDAYANLAKLADIVIAPDHMLIPGVDLDARRALNKRWAQEFIKICSPAFTPMATIHGMDLGERIRHGRELLDMGYKYLAIGGVAARAVQKMHIIEMVRQLRVELPTGKCHLHVLGLSSPDYFQAFHNIGIDSVDGSSHFKQAFTAGAFYTIVDGRLRKWQAARPGEAITAPECHCFACLALRNDGVDTRTYGSNENNMGRAAHNMNMLMKAQKIALHGTTVLVSCVSKKGSEPRKAKDLYQSDWFKKARRWAEQHGSRWYILSALHGLLCPENDIQPYEKTLNEMPVDEREQWGKLVSNQLRNIPPGRIVILAGEKYREVINTDRHVVDVPLRGMGIGQQLSWFNAQNTTQMEMFNENT